MDEKLRFVARYLDGEKIAALCREFGISRVTGHKIIDRYRESGMEAFTDRSRRPYRQANQLPFQVEALIVQIKREWPNWGAPKIRGSRPWFRCPVYGRRVAVLYHRGGRFACQHCQRIAYLSQSEDDLGRAWRRQRKAESKLVEGYGRPKGMHRSTYERLVSIIEECETTKDLSLLRFLGRMGLKI